ncbi:pilus assembly protein PilZ [Bacillus glycinifermentans]|uniref:PilZ domain-containing protein n=1 Tax=Bacillus glycinifermentans TaxID=1664069 RepID=A0A0J6EX24_9BACI|nr:PilZ domain-containing protein [Bacillus glycinifermentans]ATH91505.1 pilus assembly protein PilZ [Bacillus glycinifermentans]KMM62318.1 pilus assembly protein PilZ [Bacillus glycinifermentans]KRT93933.1 pilus assembly protein PilZ [Bacillus glycinifermentans]MEC0485167.1 PilZ domain-containing protein [Bacillus glycinifermentans]MEC0496947.1 PilZ domain-containing protein [Bacillus glycinifermentans]
MLSLGDIITIEFENENQENIIAKSKVSSIEENVLRVHYPVDVETGRTIIIPTNTIATIHFVNKQQDLYQFASVVQGREKHNNIPILNMYLPEEDQMIKIQRRQFFRVNATIPVTVRPFGSGSIFKTYTANISAGGAALIIEETQKYKPEEDLNLSISLPNKGHDETVIDVHAQVKRTYLDRRTNKLIMTVEFIMMNEHDKQTLVQYCIKCQLTERRKLKSE